MFIFPKNRHERAPFLYKFNIALILVAFFNLMACPAYAEIERSYQQHKLNQLLITEVGNEESLADVVSEMKKILTALSDNKTEKQAAAYEILEMSDPVLKQGESKQRERLQTLISILPEKYEDAVASLNATKERLEMQNKPALKQVIDTIDEQLAEMETNYNQLLSYVTPLETKSLNISTRSNNENTLLDYISQFSTDPQQQTKNGPGNLIQSEDNRIIKDARTNPEDFLSEQAESIAQIEVAKTLKALKSTEIFTTKEYHLPSYQSPLANSGLYKGESDEVILTDRIKAKAEELNYSPVEIYYWVRNNIEFVPTWGAYQTAEHTMGSRQGNAFDTASLLIALLRASNIPARYVHGTIQVSPEKFQNWIGDFEDPESAITYAGKHGLPVTSLYNRNTNALVGVEIEHAWVEAAIDFHPSRGMKNKVADTWLAMDASFKQYEYLEGIDVEEVGEIDAEQLLEDFQNSGSVNEEEGWVQGLDSSIIINAYENAQEKIYTHVNQMTEPEVGDVIGNNKVIVKEYPVLGANLENQLVTRGTDYIDVPTNYQAQIGIAMQPVLSSGLIEIEQPDITDSLVYYPLSQFNSEKVILQFTPTTDADNDALIALVPEGITDVNELPTIIGSGINVTPEIVLNDEVIITGSSLAIAREVELGLKARLPNVSDYFSTLSYDVIAGSYLDIPIVGYSVNPYKIQKTKSNVDETKSILTTNDKEQYKKLTRNEILGDLTYTGGLSYFVQLHLWNMMASQQSTDIGRVLIGYGTYGYEPRLRESGILATPTGITPGSFATNVRVHQIAWKKSKTENYGSLILSIGSNSSLLESAISEQLFCNEDVNPNNGECYGISTVSGMRRAVAQGQKIYKINSNNNDQLSNIVVSDENMANDLSIAVSSGGFVMVPEKAVRGTGKSATYVYMTYNGQTGAQAWKISGGLNGGDFSFSEDVLSEFQIAGINIMALLNTDVDGDGDNSETTGLLIGFLSSFLGTLAKMACKVLDHLVAMFMAWQSYQEAGCEHPFGLMFARSFLLIGFTLLFALPFSLILGPIALFIVTSIIGYIISEGLEWLDHEIIEECEVKSASIGNRKKIRMVV